jgi:ribosomal protein S18 acetylase RimI-like enzyme
LAKEKLALVDIVKANSTHAESIQNLLSQLGYECQLSGLISALDSPEANSDLFVATRKAQVVAFMSLVYFYYFPIQERNCRITALVVDEHVRNSGIGKKLIQFAVARAQSHSCAQLEVTTSLARKATQAYYEHNGFMKASFRYYLDIGV